MYFIEILKTRISEEIWEKVVCSENAGLSNYI